MLHPTHTVFETAPDGQDASIGVEAAVVRATVVIFIVLLLVYCVNAACGYRASRIPRALPGLALWPPISAPPPSLACHSVLLLPWPPSLYTWCSRCLECPSIIFPRETLPLLGQLRGHLPCEARSDLPSSTPFWEAPGLPARALGSRGSWHTHVISPITQP